MRFWSYILISTTVVFTGCRESALLPDDPLPHTDKPIVFAPEVSTRAYESEDWRIIENYDPLSATTLYSTPSDTKGKPVVGPEFPDGESMGVMAYTSENGGLISNYISNKKVTRSGSQYIYDNAEYWPEVPLRFFAYAPYTDGSSPYIKILPQSAGNTPTLEFTVNPDIKEQTDLLIGATAQLFYTPKVAIPLQHALTKISFAIRKSGIPDDVKIRSIALRNIVGKGSVSLIPQSSGLWLWTTSNDFNDITSYTLDQENNDCILPDNEQNISEDQYSTVTTPDGYLLLIPQTITTGRALLIVTYQVNNILKTIETTLPAALPEQPGSWDSGKNLVYNLTITPEGLVENIDIPTTEALANSFIINPYPQTIADAQYFNFTIPIVQVNNFYLNPAYAQFYNSATGIEPTTHWAVEVIWMTSANLLSLTKATGNGPNERFEVSLRRGAVGNALIGIFADRNINGLKDPDEDYMWSWHLWVTDYNPNHYTSSRPSISSGAGQWNVTGGTVQRYHSGTYGDGAYGDMQSWDPNTGTYAGKAIMDRNLGATNTSFPALENNIPFTDATHDQTQRPLNVLYYQYGRKDPFLSDAFRYRGDGSQINTLERVPATITILSSIQNPEKYPIGRNYWASDRPTTTCHWYDPLSEALPQNSEGIKSIFDPCPAGWRLPMNGTWSDFDNATVTYSDVTLSRNYLFTDDNGQTYQAIYPLDGFRNASQGEVNQTGFHGCYWSCSPEPSSSRDYFLRVVSPLTNPFTQTVMQGQIIPSGQVFQTDSFSVRCIQQ